MTTDLTPGQIQSLLENAESNVDTLDRLASKDGDWETAFIEAKRRVVDLADIIRQLQREKQELEKKVSDDWDGLHTCPECGKKYSVVFAWKYHREREHGIVT